MLLVQSIAHDRDLAPQLLLRRNDLHEALQDRPESAEALMNAAELTGWRAALLQAPLWAFLQGELRVRCVPDDGDGYRVVFDD
jgi:ribonuclease D